MEWKIKSQDKETVAALARELGLSPLLAWLLLNRGLSDPEKCRAFLDPSLDQLKPESEPAGARAAAIRVGQAIDQGETIGIHGDYDADGVTGTALLYLVLTKMGASCAWRLPHRLHDGYGIRPEGIDALVQKGASLILTVDCGVTDFEAADRAAELGVDLIVVDHHQPAEKLPPALAVINPSRPDCPLHQEPLSGVGTAFYLCIALRALMREKNKPAGDINLADYLDLVTIGTVADVVPLTGMNRVLVHFGLPKITAPQRPGIAQLKRVARLEQDPITTGRIAYGLAPRINAAGRLGSAELALNLLLAQNEREAGILADELEKINLTRRLVEEKILAEAMDVAETSGLDAKDALVVAGRDWHVGVIGIVASRLAENFGKPAAVISLRNGVGKGSLRSVRGVDVFKALSRVAGLLDAFGGHPGAAGLTIKENRVPEFVESFCRAVNEQTGGKVSEPFIEVDAEWPLSRCDESVFAALEKLKPHGMGNPEPALCARGVLVKWSREARNNTLIMELAEGGVSLPAVAFRITDQPPEIGSRIDIVYSPFIDLFGGQPTLKLKIKDFRVVA